MSTPRPPRGYEVLLDYDGHAIARHKSGHLLGFDPHCGWLEVGIVTAATADQITTECPACPRGRRKRLALHHHGRHTDDLAQVRSPEHLPGGALLVVDPFGHQERTPRRSPELQRLADLVRAQDHLRATEAGLAAARRQREAADQRLDAAAAAHVAAIAELAAAQGSRADQ